MSIKLIFDKYENDIGFSYGQYNEKEYEILENIYDIPIKYDRKLDIHTWGIKKHTPIDCDIVFDATLFNTKIDCDVKNLSGLDEIIQTSIKNHPMFDTIMERIITEIETKEPKSIGIYCNYGKHRSVGWAEIIKKIYYKNAYLKHLGIL